MTLRAALIPLSFLLVAGCQVSPYHLQEFANTADPIPFSGCSIHPNEEIDVYYGSSQDGLAWVLTSQTHSASTVSYTDSLQVSWYCWKTTMQVQRDGWWFSPPTGVYAAAVKVTDNGSPVYTYKNDPSQCTQPWGLAQLTGATPCALAPANSGNSDGNGTDFFAGSILVTAKNWTFPQPPLR